MAQVVEYQRLHQKCSSFFKVATTLVDLLFIELMSHLSHVKQTYSQSIQLTNVVDIVYTKMFFLSSTRSSIISS